VPTASFLDGTRLQSVDIVAQLIPVQFEQPDIFHIVSSMLEKYNLSRPG
jgi:hypothetical protein